MGLSVLIGAEQRKSADYEGVSAGLEQRSVSGVIRDLTVACSESTFGENLRMRLITIYRNRFLSSEFPGSLPMVSGLIYL